MTIVASRIKISFSIPFPEGMLQKSNSAEAARNGGVKFSSAFASAEMFENDYRAGVLRQYSEAVDRVADLTEAAINSDYPLGGARSINMILTHHNRMVRNQASAFLNCILWPWISNKALNTRMGNP